MPTVNEETYYLSNCNARPHAKIFGRGAFYDLGVTGHQAPLATDISKGQQCIVATPAKNGKIAFERFSLSRVVIMPDDRGVQCRAFFGDSIDEEQLNKGDAAKHPRYGIFFDKNGGFKHGHSVLRSK
jgi:hypothetical protein